MGLRSPIALDQDFLVGRTLGVGGTPSALLIDEAGNVASALAVGAGQIFALIGEETPLHLSQAAAAAA
jgi:hypothetical protein